MSVKTCGLLDELILSWMDRENGEGPMVRRRKAREAVEEYVGGLEQTQCDCTVITHADLTKEVKCGSADMMRHIATLQRQNAEMTKALLRCALKFREYEALHAAKPDPAKAQRNADMARVAEAALGLVFNGQEFDRQAQPVRSNGS